MFGRKKKETIPPAPEPTTQTVKITGKPKDEQPTVQDQILAEYQENYSHLAVESEEQRLLYAIYAEARLCRDYLAQLLKKG